MQLGPLQELRLKKKYQTNKGINQQISSEVLHFPQAFQQRITQLHLLKAKNPSI